MGASPGEDAPPAGTAEELEAILAEIERPPPGMRPPAGLRTWMGWLAAAAAVGALLRFWNLSAQVVSDDELHTLRAVLRSPASEILSSFGKYDYSLPMAALYRLLIDTGVGLNESWLRSLPLAAGLATLVILPAGAARLLGRGPAVWLAWLLAVSTPLVLYSRIARPYSWATLLAVVAVGAFWLWWPAGRWRWAGLYAGAAALGVWFLPVVAPFVGAPILWAAADQLASRHPGGWRRLAAATAGLAAASGALWLPAAGSLLDVVASKAGRELPGLETWGGALQIHAGTRSLPVAAALGLLAAWGLARHLGRDRRGALFWILPVVLQATAVELAAPLGGVKPLVLERYLLPTLPVLLGWAALALGEAWGRGRAAALAPPVVGAGLVAALLVTGPFGDPRFRASPFMHHKDYLTVHRPRPTIPPEEVPGFYSYVLPALPPGPVVELPWLPAWHHTQAYLVYQELHGRDVVAAPLAEVYEDGRLALRNQASPTAGGLLASRGSLLVLHLDYQAEELRVIEARPGYPRRIRSTHRAELHHRTAAAAAELEERWGPPDWSGAGLKVWDLERLRRAAGQGL